MPERDNTKGGIMTRRAIMTKAGKDCKQSDAVWFRHHPQRSHRLRPAFPGEITPWGFDPALLDPCDHYFVVRQLVPGVRTRLPSLWLKGARLPESEEFAHALFDFLTQKDMDAGTLFRGSDIETLARLYQTGRSVS